MTQRGTDLFGHRIREPADIQGEQYGGLITRRTPSAILFGIEDQDSVWLPLSIIRIIHATPWKTDPRTGQVVSETSIVWVPNWLAREKGLCE